jgi:chromodomain-helicase-DNA-binding protein 7
MLLLDKFIEKYQVTGHKILIFSQFKGMTEIIKEYLIWRKVRYEVLTGNVKSTDRAVAIQRFNEDDEFGVFLLTTRAGGLGINLTRARVVIIYDSDWNPQNDLQAIARAHRIGQKFEVEVFRLITAKTYEQHMFDRASKKLGMENAIFQKGAFGIEEEGQEANKMSKDDIERLLR